MSDENLSIEISANDLTGQAFASVQKQLDGISASSTQTAKATTDLSVSADKVMGLFKGAGIAAAIGTAVDQLKKYHDATRASVADIADQAAVLQIGTGQFQAIAFAFDQAGVSQTRMVEGMSRLSVQMGAANAGNKTAIDAFKALGVNILDVNGKMRDEGSVLAETAAGLLAMSNASDRANAAKVLLGLSGARLIPVLQQLAGGMGDVMDRADKAGVIISDKTVKAANDLQNQSNQTSLAIRAFYAEIGMPIETKFLEGVEKTVKSIAGAYLSANDALIKFSAGVANSALDQQIAQLDKKIAAIKDNLANPSAIERLLRTPGSTQVVQNDLAAAQKQRDDLAGQRVAVGDQSQRYSAGRAGTDRGTPAGVMDYPPDTSAGGRSPMPKTTSGGGAGGGSRDRIQEAINQLQGERAAAEKALQQMMAGAGIPLKDLDQQVALQKKIDDEIAKLGKYDPKDPRVQQIRDEVIAREGAESALKRYSAAARDADEIERRSGDGTAYVRTETQRLNEALDTGRLSYEAYGAALKLVREKGEDMRLTLEGQKGGVEGLVAGMEYAAQQWQRNNTTFAQGQRIFEASVSAMSQAVTQFATKGKIELNSLLATFLNMAAQMAMQAGASGLAKAAGGSLGGLGGLLGGIFGTAGASSPIFNVGGSIIPGTYAAGGDPPVGMPSIVGEQGPELFVPKQAGTIFNADQLAGMGGAGVTIQQTNHFGSDVSRAEMGRWAKVVQTNAQAGAMAAIINDRRRGGASKSAFRGGA